MRFCVLALALLSIAHRAVAQPAYTEDPQSSRVGRGYTDSQDAAAAYVPAEATSTGNAIITYVNGGEYRQPVSLEFITENLGILSTKLTGELFAFDGETQTLERIHADSGRSWGKVLKLSATAFAVLDRAASSVVVFHGSGRDWSAAQELPCPGVPNSLAWQPKKNDSSNSEVAAGLLTVSGQWSQRLYRFEAETDPAAIDTIRWTSLPPIDLPMCGGLVLPLPKHDGILVMDAFGRDYAFVNTTSGKVVKHDQVYGHNVSQIVALDDEQHVMFTHQLLNEFAESVRGDITWGGLLSNNIRWLKIERLLNETGPEIFSQGRFYPIGMSGDGAGDPSDFCLSEDGKIAITLGGTDRVAIGNLHDLDFKQIDVGLHPVDCEFSPDGKHLIVVNQFSDSLTLIELDGRARKHLPLGPLREPTEVERGERFFFHSKISHDNWMSCHSCHSQGHTNGQLNDNLTDDTFGTPKRILSLLGQAETTPYSWGGKFHQLEDQVASSIRSTMATDHAIDDRMVADLAAYIRSLPRPPSLASARGEIDSRPPIEKGRMLFSSLGCADCHAGDHYTIDATMDVGLVDEADMHLFNPPSLLSVSQRQNALFHDGRAKSLREVIVQHQHQLPRELDDEELESLLQFMWAL